MSIRAISEVWEAGPDGQADLLVMLALADHADDAGRCWPSVFTIARKARMSERNVRRVLTRLIAEGWIEAERAGGRNKPSIYRLTPVSWPRGEAGKRDRRIPDKVRAAVFERDGHACAYCAADMTPPEGEDGRRTLDHVVPVARGGDHAPENIVVACPECNTAKGDRTPSEWLASAAEIKPDNLATFCKTVDKGGHRGSERRTPGVEKADTAMSAEPSGTVKEPSGGDQLALTPPESASSKPAKRKRATQIGDFYPNDMALMDAALVIYGSAKPEFVEKARAVAESFVDHATDKGRTSVDWPAAWRNWVRKEAEIFSRKPR